MNNHLSNMKISELANKVKEQSLTKDKLEDYFSELSSLYAQMEERMGELEKEEAIYLNDCQEETRAGAERK